jgi:hypothetical protein
MNIKKIKLLIYLFFVCTVSYSQMNINRIDSIRFYAITWNMNVRRLPLDPNQFEPEKHQKNNVYSNVIIDSVDICAIKQVLLKIIEKECHYLGVDPRIKCFCYSNGDIVDVFIFGTNNFVFKDNKVFKNGGKLKNVLSKYLPENYFPDTQKKSVKFFDKVWYVTKIKFIYLFY